MVRFTFVFSKRQAIFLKNDIGIRLLTANTMISVMGTGARSVADSAVIALILIRALLRYTLALLPPQEFTDNIQQSAFFYLPVSVGLTKVTINLPAR